MKAKKQKKRVCVCVHIDTLEVAYRLICFTNIQRKVL